MRKLLLTVIAMILWLALVGGGALITYNEIWLTPDEDGHTTWDKLVGEFNGFMEAPFYYFGEPEEPTPEETPGDETPGDETPGDETPGDETPEGDQTGDGSVTE